MDNAKQQAIIAREVIDLYKSADNKPEVAESLDVLCFALARLTEDNPAIDWDSLSALFDQLAHSHNDTALLQAIETLYQKSSAIIAKAK